MKIKTTSGIIRKATIQKAKGGNALITSEMEPHAADAQRRGIDVSLKGTLVLATEFEVELLRKLEQTDIVMRSDFLATDTYRGLGDTVKAQQWKDTSPAVTINSTTNEHLLGGEVITIDDLLTRYNQGLI